MAACGTVDDPGTSPKNSDKKSADGTSAAGTRKNPVPVGTAAQVGDWTVTLAPTNVDATDIVKAENQFNDPPADGRQFVMVELSLTYDGDEDAQIPWVSLSTKFVGSDGNTYGTGTDDYCGVIPGNLTDVGEMYAGATATGNVCVSVPTAAVDGGRWTVEESFSFSSKPVFFALS